MTWFSVDVESDGQYPGWGMPPLAKDQWGYSMVAIGAVVVKDPATGFLGYLKPISEQWEPDALAVSGFTREDTLSFPDPILTIRAFSAWIEKNNEPGTRPIFAADNNGYDFAFTNWYCWQFLGRNPFGFSSKNINSLYQGLQRDCFASFKKLRRTAHDHNPMNDARGNAEALLYMKENMGLGVKF